MLYEDEETVSFTVKKFVIYAYLLLCIAGIILMYYIFYLKNSSSIFQHPIALIIGLILLWPISVRIKRIYEKLYFFPLKLTLSETGELYYKGYSYFQLKEETVNLNDIEFRVDKEIPPSFWITTSFIFYRQDKILFIHSMISDHDSKDLLNLLKEHFPNSYKGIKRRVVLF